MNYFINSVKSNINEEFSTKLVFPELNQQFDQFLKNGSDIIYNPNSKPIKYQKQFPPTFINSNNIFKLIFNNNFSETSFVYKFKGLTDISDLSVQYLIYSKPIGYYNIYISDNEGVNIFNINENHLIILDQIFIKKSKNVKQDYLKFALDDNKSYLLQAYLYYLNGEYDKMFSSFKNIDFIFNDVFEETLFTYVSNKILTYILYEKAQK